MSLIPGDFGGTFDASLGGAIEDPMAQHQYGTTFLGDLLGLKGRTRDIVGGLGDAFGRMVGMDAQYAPTRDQEQIGGIMSSPEFGEDPAGALRKIAAVNPTLANQMYNDLTKRQAEEQSARVEAQKAQEAMDVRTLATLGAMYSSANPETYAAMRPQMEKYAAGRGMSLPYQLPETYDPNFDPRYFAMDANQQVTRSEDAEYKDARLEDYDNALEETIRNHNMTESGRNSRSSNSIAASNSRSANSIAAANARAAQAEAGRNSRATQAEAGRNSRSNSSGSTRRPRPTGSSPAFEGWSIR